MTAAASHPDRHDGTRPRVVVVAGALLPDGWLPPDAIAARAPGLARRLQARDWIPARCVLPSDTAPLPAELAHDRWLRLRQTEVASADVATGAMHAVRRLSSVPTDDAPAACWLAEPVRLQLAQDHLVLDRASAGALDPDDARALATAAASVAAEHGLALAFATPTCWILRPTDPAAPLALATASSEAAAGRNVDGYLPSGPDARRMRRFLNDVQMTWHAARGADATVDGAQVNSLWIAGPVTQPALAAWRDVQAAGRCHLDDRLLAPRLAEDRAAWLDALATLDDALAGWLDDGSCVVLLTGDLGATWLGPRAVVERCEPTDVHTGGPLARWAAAGRRALAGLFTGAGTERPVSGSDRRPTASRKAPGTEAIARLFAEPAAGAAAAGGTR